MNPATPLLTKSDHRIYSKLPFVIMVVLWKFLDWKLYNEIKGIALCESDDSVIRSSRVLSSVVTSFHSLAVNSCYIIANLFQSYM